MAFDPSIISQIPDMGPDPVGAKAKAYTLADMIDREQLNRGQVNEQKQKASDSAAVRNLLKNSDISTYEGKLKAGEAITKINPQMGMDFIKETNATKGQQTELSQQQYELMASKNDVIGSAAVGLKTTHDQLQNQGKNPAEINAAMMPQMMQTLKQLEAATLPDGSPVLSPQDRQNYEQSLGKGYDPAVIDSIVARSKQASEVLKTKLAERKEDNTEKRTEVADAQETERERHDRATEKNATSNTDIRRKKADEARANFEGENGDLMGALAERGVSLPAGFRSKDQQVALLNSLRKRNPDLSADQIAAKIETGQLSFGNAKTEGRVAAGVAGKVTYAEHELEQTIPLVREASAKLPRGEFIPWNKLKQMGQKEMSNPDLAEYNMYMTSLSNAYDMLAARGGTDAEKRKEGRRNFDTAPSPEALEGVLRAVQNEAEVSGKAADESMQDAAGRGNPKSPTATSNRAGIGAAPTQILRFDAQGKPVT